MMGITIDNCMLSLIDRLAVQQVAIDGKAAQYYVTLHADD